MKSKFPVFWCKGAVYKDSEKFKLSRLPSFRVQLEVSKRWEKNKHLLPTKTRLCYFIQIVIQRTRFGCTQVFLYHRLLNSYKKRENVLKRLPGSSEVRVKNAVIYLVTSTEIRKIGNINPFHANVPFLYSLKMSENQRFSDVFRGYRNETLARKGLINQLILISIKHCWHF